MSWQNIPQGADIGHACKFTADRSIIRLLGPGALFDFAECLLDIWQSDMGGVDTLQLSVSVSVSLQGAAHRESLGSGGNQYEQGLPFHWMS